MIDADGALSSIERLRQFILEDPARQQALAEIEEREPFCAAASAMALAAGLMLDPAALADAIRPDPLRLDRYMPQAATAQHWPDAAWLPVDIIPGTNGDMLVQWAHFAGAALWEPFFEQSLRRAMRRPFNQLMSYRTPLSTLSATGPTTLRQPDGFVYHLSRCGSTLVAQMVGALDDAQVVSESPVIDAIVQLVHSRPDLPDALRVDLLRAIVLAYGRRGSGPFVVKLDSWHALALPLFRAAFPAVPWVFLFRDPVEILVSQGRMRGLQMVPGAFPVDLYGIDDGHLLPVEDYCALVLAKLCEAVLADDGQGGLLIDYSALPGAVAAQILPHFHIAADQRGQVALQSASARDAKNPHALFTDDRSDKQAEASAAIRAAAERHVQPLYAALTERGKTS